MVCTGNIFSEASLSCLRILYYWKLLEEESVPTKFFNSTKGGRVIFLFVDRKLVHAFLKIVINVLGTIVSIKGTKK